MNLFNEEKKERILTLGADKNMRELSRLWIQNSGCHKYAYNFSWLGRPIIQLPQDIIAMQEIIWSVQPDLIIETGIAHGGSLIFSASMLELIGGEGEVLGIDIEIREHNRVEIENHPMYKRITMIEGSSTAEDVITQVYDFAKGKKRILICLDSMHTQDHVARELDIYSPLVTKNSYLVVYDTIIEDMPDEMFADRPWGRGNNPKTAVWEFLKNNDRFIIDKEIENKLQITVAPDGYLKCVK
jgi:cephalosporin hydroxylase